MTDSGRRSWAGRNLAVWGLLLVAVAALTVTGSCRADNPSNPETFWGMPWLPEGTSTYSEKIDNLFYFIFYLTGVVFVITESLLVIFVIKYRRRDAVKSVYTHGNHNLELAWTLIPAGILGLIAILQKSTWDEIKKPEFFPKGPEVVHIQTIAKQFEWNFRYAGTDNKFGTKDDVIDTNHLVVPVGRPIVMTQTSMDVIHSFFLPNMRLKQDVVPGMQIKVWFQATKTTAQMRETHGKYVMPAEFVTDKNKGQVQEDWMYEIVCAELCGIQHGEMRGYMEVLEEKDYEAWLAKQSAGFASGDNDPKDEVWSHWKVGDPDTGERLLPKFVEKKTVKKEE